MRIRNRASESGISLQEILITMALLGIMLIVTVPNFNAYLKVTRGKTGVSKLVGAMNLGRQLAVTTRDTHLVLIKADPLNTWQLLNTATLEVVKSGEMPVGVTVEVEAVFIFDSSGSCINPTTYVGTTPTTQYVRMEALIQGSSLDRYTLEVAPTGRVKSTRERVDS